MRPPSGQHGIKPIDLVVVNLYPFAQTVARPGVTLAEAIENIDIGGPSMLRSAAKNHESVTVVVDPADYAEVAGQIKDQAATRRWNCGAAWRQRSSPARRPTTPPSPRTCDQAFAPTPAGRDAARLRCSIHAPLRPGAALRREPAPAGGALRPVPRILPATARQGTLLQ